MLDPAAKPGQVNQPGCQCSRRVFALGLGNLWAPFRIALANARTVLAGPALCDHMGRTTKAQRHGRQITRLDSDDVDPGRFVGAMPPRALKNRQGPATELITLARYRQAGCCPQRRAGWMLQCPTPLPDLGDGEQGQVAFARCCTDEGTKAAPGPAGGMGYNRHTTGEAQGVAVEIERINARHCLVDRIAANEQGGNRAHGIAPSNSRRNSGRSARRCLPCCACKA